MADFLYDRDEKWKKIIVFYTSVLEIHSLR